VRPSGDIASTRPAHNQNLLSTLRQWWKEELARQGFWPATRNFAGHIWEFARESTPAQRRLGYGDGDFDWDHLVDTTRATVAWRERLLGEFHISYQATEPAIFGEMIDSLNLDFENFTFIDIGSGKGRVLLMAADYPFRRILGIELLPALHRVAEENLSVYKDDSQRCLAVQSVCGDARTFVFPTEPLVIYLFNPLPEPGLMDVLANLDHSLRQFPRAVYMLYHNPVLEHALANYPAFNKIAGSHQYSIYRTGV
jgi:hypothetical protein